MLSRHPDIVSVYSPTGKNPNKNTIWWWSSWFVPLGGAALVYCTAYCFYLTFNVAQQKSGMTKSHLRSTYTSGAEPLSGVFDPLRMVWLTSVIPLYCSRVLFTWATWRTVWSLTWPKVDCHDGHFSNHRRILGVNNRSASYLNEEQGRWSASKDESSS